VSFEYPAKRLATLEPATSRWIATATRRRFWTILVCVAIIAAGQATGARIDGRAYIALAAWIGANLFMGPWAARPYEFPTRLKRYAMTIAVDVVILGAVYLFLDATQWLGAVFFMNAALVASATLPRRWAFGIAVLIIGVYAALVLIPEYGAFAIPSPFGVPPVRGNTALATAQIVSTLTLLILLMRLQERLVRTIREAEQRYLLLVQSAPDMVMTFDADGRFVYANPAALEDSGYTWAELKELSNKSLFPPEDWPRVMATHKRSLAGETVTMEVRYLRKNGEVRWLQTRSVPFEAVAPLDTADGPFVLVMARDITAAKRHTDDLRANEERVRMIVGALEIGFGTIDRQGRVTSIFGHWAQQQAAASRTVVGAPVRDIVHPTVAGPLDRGIEQAFAGENVTIQLHVSPPHRPAERFFRVHLAPMRHPSGDVVSVAAVWIDETAEVGAERERDTLRGRVANAERIEALAKLVSGVAHELNNPLAAILNFSEDLLADPRPDEERSALEVIQAQALRSRTIVRDLLSFVRKGHGRQRTRETPGPILETLILTVRPGLAAQGISFDASVSDPDTPLVVDRAGFEQVVTNLLTNAGQAAGAGGAVRIASRRSNEWFEVVVEDNGGGIRDEHFSRIFEPFFSTKPTGQGVGLGLSVSLGIVQSHGGELKAENRGAEAGGGARFTMRLPVASAIPAADDDGVVAAAEEPRTKPRERRTAPGSLAPLPARRSSLLVIDDEESIRRVLRRYFERRGWAVDEAPDGTTALVKLMRPDAAVLYDVVLCDMKMPGLSGPELYRRLVTDAPAMLDRLILSSGDVTATDVADFLATVSSPVLEKPFELHTLEALADTVRRQVAETA
jgi:PAS domain S-box-containing protein